MKDVSFETHPMRLDPDQSSAQARNNDDWLCRSTPHSTISCYPRVLQGYDKNRTIPRRGDSH